MIFPSTERHATDQAALLADLAQQGFGNRREVSVAVGAGTSTGAWAVKVKSHVDHNVYRVRAVTLGETGTIPVEIGDEVEAVNLAEPFLGSGTLAAGAYAVMFRVGDRNAFYAVPEE
jgi:hypothetical protein